MSTLAVFSTLGDIMSTLGGVQFTRGYHEYTGRYQDACGGYHEYTRGFSVHQRDTMSTPGDTICFVLFMIMDLPYICDDQVGYSAGGYSLSPRWFLTWYIYPFFQD